MKEKSIKEKRGSAYGNDRHWLKNGDAKTKHRNLHVRMSSEDFLEIFFKDYFFTAVLGSHQNWEKGIDIHEKNF